jgi:ABC-type lipoprotein export system ATPase subunit
LKGLTTGSRRSRGYGGRVNLIGSILPANEQKMQKIVELTKACVVINRQTILKEIDLEASQGESVAIMGPSGSGKSTLLSVLGGMRRPHDGNYHFRGQNVYSDGRPDLITFRGSKIGFVFQDFKLLPHLTLMENVMVPLEHLATSNMSSTHRAVELFEQLGIEALQRRFPHQVSGGQAQRCAIARALIRDPELILADEPTGNLDDESAAVVMEVLKGLTLQGKTLFVVTHSEKVAAQLGRTVRLNQGRVVSAV